MKFYVSDVADMRVVLCVNGLSHLVSRLPYPFTEGGDPDDADVIVLFSAKADKPVAALLDRLDAEGTTATLVLGVFAEPTDRTWRVLDASVSSGEPLLAAALSDLLSALDYYTFVQSIDIGDELSRRGAMIYQNLGDLPDLPSVARLCTPLPKQTEKALLFLAVGEDTFQSDVGLLCDELSSATGDVPLCVVAVRTLPDTAVRAALFLS